MGAGYDCAMKPRTLVSVFVFTAGVAYAEACLGNVVLGGIVSFAV